MSSQMLGRPKPKIHGLTYRQWEFALSIRQGMTHEEIARMLGVSPKSVKNAVQVINRAWGTRDKRQIILRVEEIINQGEQT